MSAGDSAQYQERTMRCGPDIPPVKIQHNISIQRDFSCSLAMVAMALAQSGFPKFLPDSLVAGDITGLTLGEHTWTADSSGHHIIKKFWGISIETRKLTFDVEVELGRSHPEIIVRPTHKPIR
jgi:hypothetical protein